MEIVGEAGDGVQAVVLAQERRPDIVLMDIQMPGLNGIEATKQIVREVPEAKVIMMTMYKEESQELAALRVGALGYVHKDTNPADLLKAVHSVARGDPYLTPQSMRRMLSKLQGGDDKMT